MKLKSFLEKIPIVTNHTLSDVLVLLTSVTSETLIMSKYIHNIYLVNLQKFFSKTITGEKCKKKEKDLILGISDRYLVPSSSSIYPFLSLNIKYRFCTI